MLVGKVRDGSARDAFSPQRRSSSPSAVRERHRFTLSPRNGGTHHERDRWDTKQRVGERGAARAQD